MTMEWSGESAVTQESVDSVTDSQNRKAIFQRRPSYREILNDLLSDPPAVSCSEEEDDAEPVITTMTMPTPIYQTSSGQYIAIDQSGAIQLVNNGTDGVQGLQTLTMANAAGAQPGTTILQYAQTSGGQQILVSSNQVVVQDASGNVQAYQSCTAPTSAFTPVVVMAASPALGTVNATKAFIHNREVRRMKNKEAVQEYRKRKKDFVKWLENRVVVLENENKILIEELKAFKDLYCHKSG